MLLKRLLTAYKKNYDSARNVRVELNMDEGTFKVIARKEVVEEVFDDRDEVDLNATWLKIRHMKLVISTKKMLHQKILSCWCTRR